MVKQISTESKQEQVVLDFWTPDSGDFPSWFWMGWMGWFTIWGSPGLMSLAQGASESSG